MNVFGLLLVGVLVALAARYLYRRFAGGRAGRSQARALVEDCHGDQDLAERLIFAEMQRDERLSIQAAARAARARLKRDRVD